MGKYKRVELEMTPHLLKKVLEWAKTSTPEDIETAISNFIELSKSDDTLTIEEFDLVTSKSMVY
jgi:hypothetical protein